MKVHAHVSRFLNSSSLAMALVLPLAAILAGCGGGGQSTPISTPAPSVSVAASPASIPSGDSSMITVTASNATQVTVSGSDGSSYTMPGTGGTQAVTPSATTTYVASATGTGGNATAKATVTVAAVPAPTVTIAANPTTVTAGSSTTLTVTASNATQVTVTGTDGSSYTLAVSGGTQVVSPSATTTYTASASGAGGSATATAKVTVTQAPPPAPTVSVTATPTTVSTGGSATLTVTATNATQVTIAGSDGSSYTLAASGGTQVVTPAATTTYTATATGAGGSLTATATVTVIAPPPLGPTVTLAASPSSVNAGTPSTLTVSASNATSVVVTGSDGSSYTLAATGGTQAVTPAATTTYTATATGAGGTVTATAVVTVTPITVTISANPTTIVAGNPTTLTVVATHATSVSITGADGSSYVVSAIGGTQTVSPTTTTTYTATASNPLGSMTATTTVTVTPAPTPTVTITANPTTILQGASSVLTVATALATQPVTITGTDSSSYTLPAAGGTQTITPTGTVIYTATATGPSSSATATATVTVTPGPKSINHVIFMLQENHTFDNYFGMLNPYRQGTQDPNGQPWNVGDDGNPYNVDGLDHPAAMISNPTDDPGSPAGTPPSFSPFKFKSTCIDDDSSDWLASEGDVYRWHFDTARPIDMNGFVHTAQGFANSCNSSGTCSGQFSDTQGQRAMGYYDQGFLNYYYFMASEFALSDRWFSPIASKSTPNRIATFTGGTTGGLVYDPGYNDHLGGVNGPSIFDELTAAGVSWKVYYSVTDGRCTASDDCTGGAASYPATDLGYLFSDAKYLYQNPSGAPCVAPTISSLAAVGDTSNYYCVDPTHVAPLSTYNSDVANGTLPSFSFIEAGYGLNDEHPDSGQPVTRGQAAVASIINALMESPSWKDSAFFFAYDEGGGPFDHVPPVPGHSNDNTDASLGTIPDIASISVNPDQYKPCVSQNYPTPTQHCDLKPSDPGASAGDASAADEQGFGAQIGFRVPNFVISPFARRHYVSHIPMDHTAVIRFVEDRFIGNHKYLTARDAAQPNLLDFFDFSGVPWSTPPTPPTPFSDPGAAYCTAGNLGP